MRSIELVGLAGSEHKYPAELSQGMRQRANLARILTADPTFFLMDEPFSALDAETKAVMQSEFMRIWEDRPRTVIFVTHDISEAALVAERVLIMWKGKIVGDIDVPFGRPRILDELRFDKDHVDFVHSLRDEFTKWSSVTRKDT
jgi:NitT/TauT family transport system ATP-binding protein